MANENEPQVPTETQAPNNPPGSPDPSQPVQPPPDILEPGQPGGDPNEPQEPQDPNAPQEPQEPQEPTPSNLSKEDMIEILREAGLGQSTQPKGQPAAPVEPQWTQAQWEEAFRVWKPDAAFLAQLRHESPDEAMKALVAMRDAVIRQAMTMADYRMQQIRDQLIQEHIQPVEAYVSEAQATSFVNEFFTKHPDLKQYEVIVDAVANKLQKEGFQGKNSEEVMKRFADDTRAVVAQLTGGKGKTGTTNTAPNNNGGTSNNGGSRRMSTLSNGGQGGQSRPGAGNKTSTGNKNVDAGLAIFD